MKKFLYLFSFIFYLNLDKVDSLKSLSSCSPGYFLSSENCVPCPPGTTSNDDSTVCVECLSGTYSSYPASKECLNCGPGLYSNSKGSTICSLCGPGTFSFGLKNSECQKCSVGYYSAQQSNLECIRCRNGEFANSNNTACIRCPNKTFSNPPGNGIDSCVKCQRGSEQCNIECPDGYYSEIDSDVCVKCKNGQYSDLYHSVCVNCPAGTYSEKPGDGVSSCTKCEDGYTAAAGSNFCTICPSSTYSNPEKTCCVTCPLGSSSFEGSSSCTIKIKVRPLGCFLFSSFDDDFSVASFPYVELDLKDLTPEICNIHCMHQSYVYSGLLQGKHCLCSSEPTLNLKVEDSYCNKPCVGDSNQNCGGEIYKYGQFDQMTNAQKDETLYILDVYDLKYPESCGPGGYFLKTKDFASIDCLHCEAGTFSISGNTSSCTPCEPGTYADTHGAPSCKLCQPGFYTPKTGATSCKKRCEPGSYSEFGFSSCKLCEPGSYSKNYASGDCTLCPAGTYSTIEGSSSQSSCIPCEEGKTSSAGSTSCIAMKHIILPLYNDGAGKYLFINIAVGTPEQYFKVILDTGSALTWVFSLNCSACYIEGRKFYNNSLSSTYVATKEDFTLNYGINRASGKLTVETVTLDNLSVKRLTIGEVNQKTSIPTHDGLLGMGFSSVGNTFIDRAFKQNLIKRKKFAIYVNPNEQSPNKGELVIAGTDKSHYEGGILYTPIADPGTWSFMVQSMNVGNIDLSCNNCNVYLDSGDSDIYGPRAAVQKIYDAFGIKGTKYINCNSDDSSFPSIDFIISGIKFSLEPKFYIIRKPKKCYIDISKDGSYENGWNFGVAFMRKYYTIYDIDNLRIGLALAKSN